MSSFRMQNGSAAMKYFLLLAAAILFVIVLVIAVNPRKRFTEARDAQRQADVDAIAEAIAVYADAHGGRLPAAISSVPTPICRSGINLDCGSRINLNAMTGSALPAIPADPKDGTAVTTGYTVIRNGNQITVAAPSTEAGAAITATRVTGSK